ncbi:DUF4255 domain-containing protein [Kitasatospora sp. NPDC058965]|uniref:DUF4255 domain-containing protein n=1 Tax=Kitasatospora sp. NPDC058965 TaxID=3346682 RepID=UPI0036BFDCCD
MIHEVDHALQGLLDEEVLAGTGIEVAFEAPTRDWVARRNAPTVNLFLYDVREDLTRRQQGWQRKPGEPGEPGVEYEAARWYRLCYLVSAWTKRPQDEHRLLSVLLAGLLPHQALGPERLTGSLAEVGAALPCSVGAPPAENRSSADLWSALGGDLKPSLELVVTAPIQPLSRTTAPLVTDALLLSVQDRDRGEPEVRRPRFEDEPERQSVPGAGAVGMRRLRGEAARSARPGQIGQ